MALISKIKGTDNIEYNVRDDVSVWGGRNLLKDTIKMSNAYTSTNSEINDGIAILTGTTANWTSVLMNRPSIPFELLNGYTIILSFEYKASIDTDFWYGLAGHAGELDSSRTKYIAPHETFTAATNWTKFSITYDNFSLSTFTAGSGDVNYVGTNFYNRTADSIFQIRHVKIERGNKATDWSPAPEDIAHVNGECLELLS